MPEVGPERRGEIMRDVLKRRGRPFNDTVRSHFEEYCQLVAEEMYQQGDHPSIGSVRGLLVTMLMDEFDRDIIANRLLFGKWLGQA
jgi:hypothetical protein